MIYNVCCFHDFFGSESKIPQFPHCESNRSANASFGGMSIVRLIPKSDSRMTNWLVQTSIKYRIVTQSKQDNFNHFQFCHSISQCVKIAKIYSHNFFQKVKNTICMQHKPKSTAFSRIFKT